MQLSSNWKFVAQTGLAILAATGWTAFAAAWIRLDDALQHQTALRDEVTLVMDQNNRLRAASQELFAQQDALIRLQQQKLSDVQQRLELRETQLRQLGVPFESTGKKP